MDGVIGVSVIGGNFFLDNFYQFNWSNGVVGQVNVNFVVGMYSVVVIDFLGCMDNFDYIIQELEVIVFILDIIVLLLCFGDLIFISIDMVFGGVNNVFEEYIFMVDNNGLSFLVI